MSDIEPDFTLAKNVKDAEPLVLHAKAAVTQKFAFLARSGAGKTYAAGVLVEGLLAAREQVIILDNVGVWHGLRRAADGVGGRWFNIPVFGGLHGDVPLSATLGDSLAQTLVAKNLSAVVDVSDLRIGEQHRFVQEFVDELFHQKKSHKGPVHIVFEEAHEFCPQVPQKGEEKMLSAVLRLARQGRNYGVGYTLISQAPQAVHKRALNLVECLVALQTSGTHERKAISAWIDEKVDETDGVKAGMKAALPSLPIGEAFIWSPQWLKVFLRAKIVKKRTYDASATPTESEVLHPGSALPEVIAESLDMWKSLVANVEKDAIANDPKRLKERVKQLLEEQKAWKESGEPYWKGVGEENTRLREEVKRLREDAKRIDLNTDHEARALLRDLAGMSNDPGFPLHDVALKIESKMKTMRATLATIQRLVDTFAVATPPEHVHAPAYDRVIAKHGANTIADNHRLFADSEKGGGARPASPAPAQPERPVARSNADNTGPSGALGLKKGARTMLSVLASRTSLTRSQLATLSGLSPTSGTFSSYLSALRIGGFIHDRPDGTLMATVKGCAAVANVTDASDPVSVRAMWMAKLKLGARRMLETLAESPSLCFTRAELANAVDLEASSGTFSSYLSSLRTNGLIIERHLTVDTSTTGGAPATRNVISIAPELV